MVVVFAVVFGDVVIFVFLVEIVLFVVVMVEGDGGGS